MNSEAELRINLYFIYALVEWIVYKMFCIFSIILHILMMSLLWQIYTACWSTLHELNWPLYSSHGKFIHVVLWKEETYYLLSYSLTIIPSVVFPVTRLWCNHSRSSCWRRTTTALSSPALVVWILNKMVSPFFMASGTVSVNSGSGDRLS